MATPNVSSTVNFVKKYPITLCGISLLFMPSVYRLLLFFTPLLISTAIFVVAMMSWGPSMRPLEKGKRRGKRNDWAFNGSLKIYDEVEEVEEEEDGAEEYVEEVPEFPQRGKTSEDATQQEDISIKGKLASDVEPAPEIKRLEPAKLREPDPDYDEDSNKRVKTASNSAMSGDQAEQDPDLQGESVEAGSYYACSAEPDPDLHGDCAASYNAPSAFNGIAEPDPDLHADPPAQGQDFSAARHLHAAPDHHHYQLPAAHDDHHHHAEPAAIHPDQHAAGDHRIYHDAEPDHFTYHDADLSLRLGCDDAERNHLDYHDADLHGECVLDVDVHAKSEDDVHAAISELRQKLGRMKRGAYSDDSLAHHQPAGAERLQTLRAAA